MVHRLDREQLHELLDFIWDRSLDEAEQRSEGAAPNSLVDAQDQAQVARMMVLRTWSRLEPVPPKEWMEMLLRVAARHDEHPDFQPEWPIL